MSSPYVHRPTTPLQYTNQFQHTPYYYTPQPSTPFIPDPSLFPGTPYASPNQGGYIPLPSAASVPNTPNRYAFPSMRGGGGAAYNSWDAYQRERRPSWHGPWIHSNTYPVGTGEPYQYPRRHSFGAAGVQPPPQVPANWSRFHHTSGLLSPNAIYTPYTSHSQFHVNPWLNAESPRSDFYFDLALPSFSPMRLYPNGQSTLLPPEEMYQPATHPPLTALRIVCDFIPQWPIELALSEYMAGAVGSANPYYMGGGGGTYTPPPITLADVLVAVHRAMHKRISHADWAKLSRAQELEVGRAYTQRCKAVPSMVEHERAQGVKRVDYLMGRTRVRGLVRVGWMDGWETMKLIVV